MRPVRNDLESRLRDAFAAKAASVSEDSVAGLAVRDVADDARPGSASTSRQRWLVPLAAAVATILVGAGIILVGRELGSQSPPGPSHRSQNVPTAPVISLRPDPRSYLSENGPRFDVGDLQGSFVNASGRTFLLIHRLAVYGGSPYRKLPDPYVATHPQRPSPHTDAPYGPPSKKTIEIPVRANSAYTYNACVPDRRGGQKLDARALTLAQYLESPGTAESLIHVDAKGRLVSIETSGGC